MHAREPEVSDLDPTICGDQQVLRLDVAVHQPRDVGRVQPGRRRVEQRRDRASVGTALEPLGQRSTVDQLHGQVDLPIGQGVGVEQRHHVGMGQPRQSAGLVEQRAAVRGAARSHQLERDGALESLVPRAVDLAVGTASEPFEDQVPADADHRGRLREQTPADPRHRQIFGEVGAPLEEGRRGAAMARRVHGPDHANTRR